jgi:phosphatidylethanolamine-binding protein (PEBP) family uncharacterized protein
VQYPSKSEDLGNEFPITGLLFSSFPNLSTAHLEAETLVEPQISFDPEFSDLTTRKYTYIQVDPDAPSPNNPSLSLFLHHIKYDLQAACVVIQERKTQVPYFPLTPLSVAKHRYVSLLYGQLEGYVPPKVDILDEMSRAKFNVTEYVKSGGLVLVGGNSLREGALTPPEV